MKQRLSWLYAAAIEVVSRPDAGAGGRVRQERLVQDLVDLSEQAPDAVRSLANLRGGADDAAEHAVAVAVLATLVGRRLKLPRRLLAELAMMALTYCRDLPSAGSEQLRTMFVADLTERPGLADEGLRAALILVDWRRDHCPGDGRTSPRSLAQILRVTADYDRLTRSAAGQAPLAARAAAQALEEGRDVAYDPVVVDLLLSVLRLDGRSDTTPLGALELKRTRTPAA